MAPGQVQIASPLNDDQLVILAAAHILAGGKVTAQEAFDMACEVVARVICGRAEAVAEALERVKPGIVAERQAKIDEAMKAAEADAAAQNRRLLLAGQPMPAAAMPPGMMRRRH